MTDRAEYMKEFMRQDRLKFPEKHREKARAYYLKNKEKINANGKQWASDNRAKRNEQMRLIMQARRRTLKGAIATAKSNLKKQFGVALPSAIIEAKALIYLINYEVKEK